MDSWPSRAGEGRLGREEAAGVRGDHEGEGERWDRVIITNLLDRAFGPSLARKVYEPTEFVAVVKIRVKN